MCFFRNLIVFEVEGSFFLREEICRGGGILRVGFVFFCFLIWGMYGVFKE